MKNPLLTSEEQNQGTMRVPYTQHHEVVGRPPKPPLWTDPCTTPTLTPHKEPAPIFF